MPFGRRCHARGRWPCRGKYGRAPQHARPYRGTLYRASDSARAAGSSIVDELGECRTLVHENKTHGPGEESSEGKADR